VEHPGEEKDGSDFKSYLNPNSLEVVMACFVEPSLAEAGPGCACQFEGVSYFCVDPDSAAGALVFNRTVGLRDPWAKIAESGKG
jgi:glutaminyl-tRNA synthetase